MTIYFMQINVNSSYCLSVGAVECANVVLGGFAQMKFISVEIFCKTNRKIYIFSKSDRFDFNL